MTALWLIDTVSDCVLSSTIKRVKCYTTRAWSWGQRWWIYNANITDRWLRKSEPLNDSQCITLVAEPLQKLCPLPLICKHSGSLMYFVNTVIGQRMYSVSLSNIVFATCQRIFRLPTNDTYVLFRHRKTFDILWAKRFNDIRTRMHLIFISLIKLSVSIWLSIFDISLKGVLSYYNTVCVASEPYIRW